MVYVDLIFLVNFLFDGALLLTTAWTRKLRIRLWRIGLAAALGAGYVLLLLVPGLTDLFTFAAKFAVSGIMVGIAFGFGTLQAFLRNLAAFYAAAFVSAGGIFALYYFFLPPDTERMLSSIFRLPEGYGYGIVAAGLLFSVWFYLRVLRGAKQKEALSGFMAEVEVLVQDFRLTCSGLVDTGNQLYDPLTKTPVMIVEASLWKDVLPEGWLKRIQTSDVDQIIAAMGGDSFIWQDRLRIVPYRGVNRTTQFMLAIKPDKVKLQYGGREREADKVLIGFDGGTLSSDGSYRAIIHPMLLQD